VKEDIKQKFGAIAREYDNQRKSLIPCFDDFYNSILECIPYGKNSGSFLDIGAGTGLLTSFIHQKYPDSRYTLIDISDEMIIQAKSRFPEFRNFNFITADYTNYKFQDKYDVVVSSLSIHHLTDTEKRLLFKEIHTILNNNGFFINGDQFIHKSAYIEDKIQNKWKNKIANSNLKKEDIEAAYERMKMDKPASTNNNMKWMEEAGFTHVELIYKYFPFGVIFGLKE
jgi:tRNA (cmo5U34)-methyltransferase